MRVCRTGRTMLFILLSLAAVCLVVTSARCENDPRAAHVDSMMKEWVDPDSPGAAIVVVRDEEILYEAGYGMANIECGLHVTPSTVFNVGSLAKQFTAFAIALLVERGNISLDDDIRTYLPEVPDFDVTITIRNLIGHTSGLREHYDLLLMAGWDYHDVIEPGQILKLVSKQRQLNFAPGEDWLYCNTGYTLLAEIIARITGQSFAAWMSENVFGPLGMSSTQFPERYSTPIENRAYSYNYVSSASGERYEIDVLSSNDVGCSNLWTTVEDMVRWISNLDDPGIGGPSVGRLLAERAVLNSGEETDYAFGHFIGEYKGLPTVSHSGKVAAYRSYLIRFPEQRFAVAVMCNGSWIMPTVIGKKIADIYLDGFLEAEKPEEVKPAVDTSGPAGVTLDSSVLESYAGHYKLQSGKLLEVKRSEDHLLLFNLSSEPFELLALSDTLFQVKESMLKLSFSRDEENTVDGLTLNMGSSKIAATKTELAELSEDELAAYAGVYYSDELSTLYQVIARGGALFAVHGRHPDTELVALGDDEFQGENRWLRSITFDRSDNGDVIYFRVGALGVRGILFQKIPSFSAHRTCVK